MATNLFWTGGWDSTFRLHQLVFDLKKLVQPIYIIDETRRSLRMELKAISMIKRAIRVKDAAAGARILPTRIAARGDIPENLEITEAHARLRPQTGLGDQYEWLGRYACLHEGEPIEMSVECNTNRRRPLLECLGKDGCGMYVVQPDAGNEDMFAVFRYYRFPLLDFSKAMMRSEAREKGWEDVLNLSWFCHTPRADETPCGRCSACRQVLKSGLGHRIPWPRRIKGWLLLATVNSSLGLKAKTTLKRWATPSRQ